jgi:hypothetical protein
VTRSESLCANAQDKNPSVPQLPWLIRPQQPHTLLAPATLGQPQAHPDTSSPEQTKQTQQAKAHRAHTPAHRTSPWPPWPRLTSPHLLPTTKTHHHKQPLAARKPVGHCRPYCSATPSSMRLLPSSAGPTLRATSLAATQPVTNTPTALSPAAHSPPSRRGADTLAVIATE